MGGYGAVAYRVNCKTGDLKMSTQMDNALFRGKQLLSSNSRAFAGPQAYIQGPGEFQHIFELSSKLGRKALVVIDQGIFEWLSKRLEHVSKPEGFGYTANSFFGESCRESIDGLKEIIKNSNCDMIIGIGGGKALDTTKFVSDELDIPRVIVPTSAANDNPVAALAVLYTSKGEHISGVKMKRATDLVLVDTEIIANAPARLFIAGIADALATWYEAKANELAMTENCVGKGYRRCRAGMAVARECFEVLLADGEDALEAVKQHVVTEALENVVEANILLSGLGFINTGCAAAHGLHSAFSQIESSHNYLHGEKVSFGLVCEMVLENTPKEELDKVLKFMVRLGLPVTFADINIEMTDDNLDTIVHHAVHVNALCNREPVVISDNIVRHAMIRADELGRAYKEGRYLNVL